MIFFAKLIAVSGAAGLLMLIATALGYLLIEAAQRPWKVRVTLHMCGLCDDGDDDDGDDAELPEDPEAAEKAKAEAAMRVN